MPPMVIGGTCSTTFSSREQHKEVEASWHDTKEAKRKVEKAPSNPEGKAKYSLRHNHDSQDGAKRAAKSRADELRRQAEQTQVTIEGNVAARGGGNMVYAGMHPAIDGLPWIIETATHTLTKGAGYRAAIAAKAKV